jgi:hypothetical protein
MFKEPQESIPPAYVSLAGRYVKVGCGTGPPGWESILGSFKRFTNSGSEFDIHRSPGDPRARALQENKDGKIGSYYKTHFDAK